MTVTAMPDPVAAQSKFADSSGWAACSVEHHQMVQADPDVWPGYETRTLITTDQAEAYAAAKVREALEEAAKVCDLQANEPECPERASYCAEAIRTLSQ